MQYTNKRSRATYSIRCRLLAGHRHGISLVEMMVVIVCIGTLLCLLLNSVHRVRDAARRTQCANNTRQLAVAILQTQVVTSRLPTVAGSTYDDWAMASLPHLEESGLRLTFDRRYSPVDDRNHRSASLRLGVHACPDRPRQGSDTFAEIPAANYGMNGALQGLRRIREAARTPLVGETPPTPLLPWVSSPGFWPQDLGAWHGPGGNVAYADGHVAWLAHEPTPGSTQ
jgi:prepilin-type processing-associated H-X9-DG protein